MIGFCSSTASGTILNLVFTKVNDNSGGYAIFRLFPTFNEAPQDIPEPAMLGVFLLGLAGLAAGRTRAERQRA